MWNISVAKVAPITLVIDTYAPNPSYFFYHPKEEIVESVPDQDELTHWGRDKMAVISQTTLSNAFS